MRFIQGTTTAFLLPSTGTSDYSRTLSIDQYNGTFTPGTVAGNVFTGAAAASVFLPANNNPPS